jgi:Protein of unknown function (DUF3309)
MIWCRCRHLARKEWRKRRGSATLQQQEASIETCYVERYWGVSKAASGDCHGATCLPGRSLTDPNLTDSAPPNSLLTTIASLIAANANRGSANESCTRPRVDYQRYRYIGGSMLGTILIVLLVLFLVGALPTWNHSRSWGYFPSGGLGLVLVIVIILLLLGRI